MLIDKNVAHTDLVSVVPVPSSFEFSGGHVPVRPSSKDNRSSYDKLYESVSPEPTTCRNSF